MIGEDSIVAGEVVAQLATLQMLGQSLRSPIELPQIVVLGSQSSGKSSVIESLVGLSFLPRGTGIVTRVPLLLHLRDRGCEGDDYAVFAHEPDVEYRDFDAVRDEIVARTEVLAGKTKGVADKPIVLRVHAAGAPALTLVDLPGVTKVPVLGQPEDIEQRIRNLCMTYANNSRAILLCVTPANCDVANSDALRLAREVDRQGKRTIGVLTKLDLMDAGTDALSILRNEVLPLKLGYVAVVCRGHLASSGGADMMRQQRTKEKAFFDAPNGAYAADQALRKAHCGVATLAGKLSDLLVAATREAAPALRSLATARLNGAQRELDAMATSLVTAESAPKHQLLEVVLEYAGAYVDLLKGDSKFHEELVGGNDTEIEDDGRDAYPRGAATIQRVFEDVFGRSLADVDALDGLSDADVRAAIRATSSLPPTLFVPERAFHSLIRTQIARLEEPGLKCVELVHDELRRCAEALVGRGRVAHAPQLAATIRTVVHDVTRELVGPARTQVSELVACELAYINTRHPDFEAAIRSLNVSAEPRVRKLSNDFAEKFDVPQYHSEPAEAPREGQRGWFGGAPKKGHDVPKRRRDSFVIADTLQPRTKADDRADEVATVKALVEAYFGVVRKTFTDLVPKIVMAKLVEKVNSKLRADLVKKIFSGATDREAGDLLREPEHLREARRSAEAEVTALRGALGVLDDIEAPPRPALHASKSTVWPASRSRANVEDDEASDSSLDNVPGSNEARRRDTITLRKRTPQKSSAGMSAIKEKENRRAALGSPARR
ncbi:P-loop containing nucleoside triphosphate hydrolase protein [Pelagophyceae sp. CCMP2097]|nr:P-loop containing nucleoside triphosphate hydrolase protein [Pelagophyceae sp. CCMP2097]